MNVDELYSRLSYGELSNLSMALDGNGSIEETSQPKIINAANEALLRLYSRFVLKQRDVLVEMVEHITNYHLLRRFTESQGNPTEEPYLYIKDLLKERFEQDVIKILEVYDSRDNYQLPLNDAERSDSLFTPQANVLQVPRPQDGVCLSVMYQARHPKLYVDDTEQEIELPDVLEGALMAYIAYKVYSQINTQEAQGIAQGHAANYEAVCLEAVDRDLVSTSVATTNTRFYKRGWI